MIRKAEASDINECVRVIREGFKTVADEFDITPAYALEAAGREAQLF